jgi:hypothetical protein
MNSSNFNNNLPIKMSSLYPENPLMMMQTTKNFWNTNTQKMKHRNSIDLQ